MEDNYFEMEGVSLIRNLSTVRGLCELITFVLRNTSKMHLFRIKQSIECHWSKLILEHCAAIYIWKDRVWYCIEEL